MRIHAFEQHARACTHSFPIHTHMHTLISTSYAHIQHYSKSTHRLSDSPTASASGFASLLTLMRTGSDAHIHYSKSTNRLLPASGFTSLTGSDAARATLLISVIHTCIHARYSMSISTTPPLHQLLQVHTHRTHAVTQRAQSFISPRLCTWSTTLLHVQQQQQHQGSHRAQGVTQHVRSWSSASCTHIHYSACYVAASAAAAASWSTPRTGRDAARASLLISVINVYITPHLCTWSTTLLHLQQQHHQDLHHAQGGTPHARACFWRPGEGGMHRGDAAHLVSYSPLKIGPGLRIVAVSPARMYVCMYVYVHVCMYVCMIVPLHTSQVSYVNLLSSCMHACMYVCMYVCMHVCMHA
jgi:hypothetical protein